MRCRNLLSVLIALSSAPLAAQGFEGTLAIKLPGAAVPDLTWQVKRGRSVASHHASNPRIGEFEAKYYLDRDANTNTFLVPIPGMDQTSDIRGVKIVRKLLSPVDQASAAMVAGTKPRKLGTTQTVAGMTCDDYELPDGAKTRACLASGMGIFAYPDVPLNIVINTYGPPLPISSSAASSDGESFPGMMAAMRTAMETSRAAGVPSEGIAFSRLPSGVDVVRVGGQSYIVGGDGVPISNASIAMPSGSTGRNTASGVAPPWARTIGDLGFPLRVWSAKGTTLLEVIRADRTPIEDRVFAVPTGYREIAVPTVGGGTPGR